MISFIDGLVKTFEIEGRLYQLNMAYDNIILINEKQNEKSLSDVEQLLIGAKLLFLNFDDAIKKTDPTTLLLDFQAAYKEVVTVKEQEIIEYDLLGNPMPKKQKNEDEDDQSNGAEYCFIRDADFIYSSFIMDYNINLMDYRGKMHWHEFRALLNGLSDKTIFKKVMSIRSAELPKDNASREKLLKQKELFALKPRN